MTIFLNFVLESVKVCAHFNLSILAKIQPMQTILVKYCFSTQWRKEWGNRWGKSPVPLKKKGPLAQYKFYTANFTVKIFSWSLKNLNSLFVQNRNGKLHCSKLQICKFILFKAAYFKIHGRLQASQRNILFKNNMMCHIKYFCLSVNYYIQFTQLMKQICRYMGMLLSK